MSRYIDIDSLPMPIPDDCASYDELNEFAYAIAEADEVYIPTWIQCSKKLPEYMVPVLTWDGHMYAVEKRIQYIRDEDGEPIKSEWWVSDDFNEQESDYYPNLRDGAAIAWKPIEPYKENGR